MPDFTCPSCGGHCFGVDPDTNVYRCHNLTDGTPLSYPNDDDDGPGAVHAELSRRSRLHLKPCGWKGAEPLQKKSQAKS